MWVWMKLDSTGDSPKVRAADISKRDPGMVGFSDRTVAGFTDDCIRRMNQIGMVKRRMMREKNEVLAILEAIRAARNDKTGIFLSNITCPEMNTAVQTRPSKPTPFWRFPEHPTRSELRCVIALVYG